MSLQDDLASAQRSVDELTRVEAQLERQVGDNLDMRRVRQDTVRLRESLAILRESAPGREARPPEPQEMITVPDTPYNPALWAGGDDEGLGSPYHHAP